MSVKMLGEEEEKKLVGKEKVIKIGSTIFEGKSVVYNGEFDDKPVAVKYILNGNKDWPQELKTLRAVNHKNVVNYLFKDTCETGISLFIVMEMCKYTLKEFIDENLMDVTLEPYDILKQITDGLDYLHNVKKLIHRDLKPSNILLVDEDDKWTVKLSDFGISTQLTQDRTSVTLTSKNGTVGYIAPEILNADLKSGSRVSKEADIFSLGIVYHYVLSGGEHPFDAGDDAGTFQIDKNICDESFIPNLGAIKTDYVIDTNTLVSCMIKYEPKLRPKVNQVRAHHIFWDELKTVRFLECVSNGLKDQLKHQKLINKLEKEIDEDTGKDWGKKLREVPRCPGIRRWTESNCQKEAKCRTVWQLLRQFRNWLSHFDDPGTTEQFRKDLGGCPEGLLRFFISNFPKLLAHTYNVMKSECELLRLQNFYDTRAVSAPDIDTRSGTSGSSEESGPGLPVGVESTMKMEEGTAEPVTLTTEPMEVDDAPAAVDLVIETNSRKRDHDGQTRSESIRLHKYQLELAQQALNGNNSMIIAPTGSGKTMVAIAIIKDRLKKFKEKHVMFFVSKSALAEQQYRSIDRHLHGHSVAYITGKEVNDVDAGILMKEHCVTVLTPQILINELIKTPPGITFDEISLMIFDECHHTTKKHPYKAVMDKLLDAKKGAGESLSVQVIGLTASPGVGKAGGDKVLKNLLALLAGLNITLCPATVTENLEELQQHQHEIEEKYFPVECKEDDFTRKLLNAIRMAEDSISKLVADTKVEATDRWIHDAPKEKHQQPYENWTSELINYATIKVDDRDMSCKIRELAEHLNMYHDWLTLKNIIRNVIQYTMELGEKRRPVVDDSDLGKTNQELMELSHCFEVPMLDKLIEILKVEFKSYAEGRCIIFVQRKLTARCLVECIKNTKELATLEPAWLIGGKGADSSCGMSGASQNSVLRAFRGGACKVLVATSIAEEGIDIPACNLVISYYYVTGEVGRIQRAGRGRAVNSKCVLIASVDSGHFEKEKYNRLYAKATESALQELCKKSKDQLRDEILAIQKLQSAERRSKPVKQINTPKDSASQWKILCRCRNPITTGDKLCHIENTHTVIKDPEFGSHVTKVDCQKQKGDMEGTADFLCLKCRKKVAWNMKYMGCEYPTLALRKVIFESDTGKKRFVKKRIHMPFEISKGINDSDEENLEEVDSEQNGGSFEIDGENLDSGDVIDVMIATALDDDM